MAPRRPCLSVQLAETTDQASGKFDEVHTEFVTAANEVMESLDLLSEWLDKAVQALQDMDTQLAGSLNK